MTTEQDMVETGIDIAQKAEFNIIELYHLVKDWFDINKYVFYEREHEERIEDGKKSLKVKWRGLKDVDDYTKLRLDLSLGLKNYEITKKDSEKLVTGDLKIRFSSRVIVDHEEKWSYSPVLKFLRGLSDKFFPPNTQEKLKKELKNDTYDIYHKVKAFLNMQKFK